MTHTLLLIRHAKAVRDGVPDELRQLAPRGLRDAAAVGVWISARGLIPDLAVVSPATRTVETWHMIAGELGAEPGFVTDERIYDDRIQSMLAVLTELAEDATTVAMVGHNPSMHGLAMALDDGQGPEDARAGVAEAFPTSAVAVLDVPSTWAQLARGTASLREFAVPRG